MRGTGRGEGEKRGAEEKLRRPGARTHKSDESPEAPRTAFLREIPPTLKMIGMGPNGPLKY
jgi:hypothetical protein